MFARDAASDGFRMSMFTEAENGADYMVHDPPRPREFFDPVVLDSYARISTFMNWLRISRVFDGYSLDLIDRKLYVTKPAKRPSPSWNPSRS